MRILLNKDPGEGGFDILRSLVRINQDGLSQVRAYMEDIVKIDDYHRPPSTRFLKREE